MLKSKMCGKGSGCLNILKDLDGFLPISEFYEDKHKSSGYRSECKSCCNKPPKWGTEAKKQRNFNLIEEYKKGVSIPHLIKMFDIAETSIHRILRANKIERIDNYEDLIGRVFTRLTVVGRTKQIGDSTRYWDCVCDCGKTLRVQTKHLNSGHTKSCGCYSAEMASKRLLKHGQAIPGQVTKEYHLYKGAKTRSSERGEIFTLELSDIIIPKNCPILGIPLFGGTGSMCDNSPTLDRINNTIGYVKENIQVISHKANAMKRNGNLEDVKKLYEWMKSKNI